MCKNGIKNLERSKYMTYKYILPIILLIFLLGACSSNESISGTTASGSSDTVNENADTTSQADKAYDLSSEVVVSNVIATATEPYITPTPSRAKASELPETSKAPKASDRPSAKSLHSPPINQSKKPSATGTPKNNFQSQVDVMGEVESVLANSIKVKLIEIPQSNRDRNSIPRPSPDADGSSKMGEMPSDSNMQGRPNRQEPVVKYTGESKILRISTQVSIFSTKRAEQGMEEIKLELKDIIVGDVISAWYSDNSTDTVSRISVRMKK
jgi:hypothetical protein